MIDRSYLPYASAVNFRDRGMAKWMGFFLSEHTSALGEFNTVIDLSSHLKPEEKMLYLSQLYSNQEQVLITIKEKKQKRNYIASIHEVSLTSISLKLKDGYKSVTIEDILQIEMIGGVDHECLGA